MDAVLASIKQISRDYTEQNAPFNALVFPEEYLLNTVENSDNKLHAEQKLRFLTLFSTLDYNRNATQLAKNIIEFYTQTPHNLNPTQIDSEEKLTQQFQSIKFRYSSRDAHAWFVNSNIISDQYNGDISNLLEKVNYDAPDLVSQIRKDNFLYLKGKKIAPMYARFISTYIHPLTRLWKLDIPVDTHINRLTTNLIDQDLTNDETRFWWRNFANEYNISRHVVDGALWQIGNNWTEWGETYWNTLPHNTS